MTKKSNDFMGGGFYQYIATLLSLVTTGIMIWEIL